MIYWQTKLISTLRSFSNFSILVTAGGLEEWISDGSCDDINNNVPCQFDGGDCCGSNVLKQYCFECNCIGNFCETMRKYKEKQWIMVFLFSVYTCSTEDDCNAHGFCDESGTCQCSPNWDSFADCAGKQKFSFITDGFTVRPRATRPQATQALQMHSF